MPTYTNYAGEIAAQLNKYRTLGQKEASAHRPPTDSLTLDQHEASLMAEAEKWSATEQRLFDAVVADGSKAAVDLNQKGIELEGRIAQLLSDRSIKGAVEADMAGERRALVATTSTRMKHEVALRHFRVQNGITDAADYPDSRIWHIGVVLALALVETLVNAFFYENEQGLLGGFVVALSVAAVNMFGALALGLAHTFKNLSAIDKRIFGWSALLVFVAFSLYCNALFASFRAEYQILADPSNPHALREAFAVAALEAKKIFYLDMRFADLMSFILFGLGLLLSILAFYKGYTLDDRYPGHGRRDRAAKLAKQQELELQDLLRQKIRDALHQKRAEAQGLIHEPAQLISQTARRYADVQAAQATLKNQIGTVNREFSMTLMAYRTANTAVRATEPPAYFKTTPQLVHQIDVTAAESVMNELESVKAMLNSLREKYQDKLHDRLNELQQETSSILDQTFSDFIREIEGEAQEHINRLVHAIDRAG